MKFTGVRTRTDVHRLSDQKIRRAQPREVPYRLNDGGNLYLVVYPSAKKSFELRYVRYRKTPSSMSSPSWGTKDGTAVTATEPCFPPLRMSPVCTTMTADRFVH